MCSANREVIFTVPTRWPVSHGERHAWLFGVQSEGRICDYY